MKSRVLSGTATGTTLLSNWSPRAPQHAQLVRIRRREVRDLGCGKTTESMPRA